MLDMASYAFLTKKWYPYQLAPAFLINNNIHIDIESNMMIIKNNDIGININDNLNLNNNIDINNLMNNATNNAINAIINNAVSNAINNTINHHFDDLHVDIGSNSIMNNFTDIHIDIVSNITINDIDTESNITLNKIHIVIESNITINNHCHIGIDVNMMMTTKNDTSIQNIVRIKTCRRLEKLSTNHELKASSSAPFNFESFCLGSGSESAGE
jgi:hypothetical protein